jgi:hypothetical protein
VVLQLIVVPDEELRGKLPDLLDFTGHGRIVFPRNRFEPRKGLSQRELKKSTSLIRTPPLNNRLTPKARPL